MRPSMKSSPSSWAEPGRPQSLTDLIETDRLVMRLPRGEDVPAIVDFYGRNHDHLQPWSPVFPSNFLTEGYWRDQVVHRHSDYEAGRSARTFLFHRDRPDRVIGNLSLTQIERGPAQCCVLGYSLDEREQGHGYMLEAVQGAVDFAFRALRLHRVAASYMPHNRRSAAVLRRAGFVVEGYAREYLLINSRWEDHILTAITNPSWGS